MKNFVIVSTYPESGSKNIGDQLITTCLRTLLVDMVPDAKISVIWRALTWDTVKDIVLGADHVFFACLALRPKMHNQQYPYLNEVVDSGVPFSVIAAGTSLPVENDTVIYDGFSDETHKLLRKVNDKAVAFTSRGGLTQEFCIRAGMDKSVFGGDVAFYDTLYDELRFSKGVDCRRIIVSDPHRALCYLDSLKVLIYGLRDLFPEAELVIAQHGFNRTIDKFCLEQNIKTEKIYEDRYEGLKIYDWADLHVGFRVHGHVSALKRRKYSYLLEQDGRGCDYGATLERKISVQNFCYPSSSCDFINLVKFLLRRPVQKVASVSPVYQLLTIIRQDFENDFERFCGLERQIYEFNSLSLKAVKKALHITNSVNKP